MCIKDHYPSVASFGLTKPAVQNVTSGIPVNHATPYSHLCEPPPTVKLSLAMCPALTVRTLAGRCSGDFIHVCTLQQSDREAHVKERKSRTLVPVELPGSSQHKLPRM